MMAVVIIILLLTASKDRPGMQQQIAGVRKCSMIVW